MKTLQLNTRNAKQGDEVIISSGSQLRHQDYWSGKMFRLVPSGIRTEHWLENPVMLYQHDPDISLGTADIFHEGGQLKARNLTFHRKRVPVGGGEIDTGLVADLWEEGWINAVSNHIMLTKDDIERVLESEEEIIIPTSEMLEFSIVTLPADRDAVRRRAMEMGLSSTIAASLFEQTAVTRDSGIIEVVTQAATAHNDGATVTEDIMELENEVQEETQTPPVDGPNELETAVQASVEEVEVEEVIEISAEELVNALAESPEAIRALAQAVAEALREMPEAISALASAMTPQARSTRLVINTANTSQRQSQAQANATPRIAASAPQTAPAPQRIESTEGDKPKKFKLTGMVRQPA